MTDRAAHGRGKPTLHAREIFSGDRAAMRSATVAEALEMLLTQSA
jgi:nicotinamide mononucleotide (NMN) deamidase PncC